MQSLIQMGQALYESLMPQIPVLNIQVTFRHSSRLSKAGRRIYTYQDQVSGQFSVVGADSYSVSHTGITCSLIGSLIRKDSAENFVFETHLVEEKGTINGKRAFPFFFRGQNKRYNSYEGTLASVNYCIRVTVQLAGKKQYSYDEPFLVVNTDLCVRSVPFLKELRELKPQIQMLVCLPQSQFYMDQPIEGKIVFSKLQVQLQAIELQMVRQQVLLSGAEEIEAYPIGGGACEIADGNPSIDQPLHFRVIFDKTKLVPSFPPILNKFELRNQLYIVLVAEDKKYYFPVTIKLFRRPKNTLFANFK